MKFWTFLFALILSVLPSVSFVAAQEDADPPLRPERNPLRKEGQLLTVEISRGRPVRIFVAGREEAKIDLSNLKISLRRVKPSPGKVLEVDPSTRGFVVRNPEDFEKVREIEIETRLKGQSEIFHFDLGEGLP